jgi:hypothetical protein
LSALVLSSCTKKEDIGQELMELPGDVLGVEFTDTVSMITYSNLVDSFKTDEIKVNMLGSYFDPVMGVTTAGFFTQVRLVNNDIDFGTKAVFDSIVLTLDYSFIYGEDSMAVQTIKVYEVTQDMYRDSSYYSNSKIAYDPQEIANLQVVFNNRDSIYEGDAHLHAHLRLRLDDAFGLKIFDKSGQQELSNNEEFVKFIKGLYVTAEKRTTPGGDLAGIPLLSSYSRLAIFYHDDKDTMIENFVINENTARVQVFDHYGYQDASADFINQVINGDSALGQQTFYLQPMAGVKTALRFPHLQELVKNRKIAINKAEIILKPDANMMDFEGPPPNIVLVKVAADGSYLYTKDHGEDVQGGPRYFYGGWYNELEKEYYFTVTRHLQSILDGDEIDRGMYILIEGSGITANRVIFPGPEATNGVRLRLYYTIVEKEKN